VTLADAMPPAADTHIHLSIERGGKAVFSGNTTVATMARPFEELIGWLGKETSFPYGVVLLTGTGIVPPDDFTLAAGDVVRITIAGIGELTNPVATR
jgi:2-dehydro-3-deoxy-D-arabinonate dehydratase